MLYFAYGANTDPVGMTERCPRARLQGRGTLAGYRLEFRREADVTPCDGATVEGLIWQVTGNCLAALDAFEEYPEVYDRLRLPVRRAVGGDPAAWVYVMVSRPPLTPPNPAYLSTLRRGYAAHRLPPEQLNAALDRARDGTR